MIRSRLFLLSTIGLWATPSPEPARAGDAGGRSAAPLVPLATGKTMRIRGLDVVPLEATVPPNFRFRMEGPGEDFGDSAHLAGPDSVDVEIAPPDDGKFFSLAQQRKFLKDASRAVSIVREQALPSGFAVVYEDKDAESKPEFAAIVSLPNLGVVCSAIFLHSLEDAELCVSICLSLRLKAVEQLLPAPQHANPGWTEHLVSAECPKIATKRGNVEGKVCSGLCGVDNYGHARGMR
jgi:hypothetical protein